MVADGDRNDPPDPAPWADDVEARIGDPGVPGHHRGGRRRERPPRPGEQRRLPGDLEAVAGDAHDALQRPGTISAGVMVPGPPAGFHGGQRPPSGGWLVLAQWAVLSSG